jgi:hypothetical protein
MAAIDELPEWPLCELCEEEFDPRRKALGYNTCLSCGSPKKEFCSVPMHKSGFVLVTDKAELKYVTVQTPRTDGTS